jgi:Leucine-rich repeat (LRR) protein
MRSNVDFISPAAPAFSTLSILELQNLNLFGFRPTTAKALKHLAVLDLSHNKFSQLPMAVSRITTLEKLNMSYNYSLQLDTADSHILAALPNLRILDISKGTKYVGWSQKGIDAVIAIMERLPGLIVHGLL